MNKYILLTLILMTLGLEIQANPQFPAFSSKTTQFSIMDGMSRYQSYWWPIFWQRVTSIQWQDINHSDHCGKWWFINAASSSHSYSFSNWNLQISNAAQSKITLTFDMQISVQSMHVRVGESWCVGPIRFSQDFCNNNIEAVARFTSVAVDFRLAWNNGLQVTATIASLPSPYIHYSGCHESWFAGLIDDLFNNYIQKKIHDSIEDEITSLATQFSQSWSLPTTYNVSDHIYIQYELTSLAFVDGEVNSIITTANATVIAEVLQPNGQYQNITFQPDPDRFLLPPTQSDLHKGSLDLEAFVRASSQIWDALMWAAQMIGVTNVNKTFSIEGANISMRMHFEPLVFGVTPDNTINLFCKSGYLYGICLNEDEGPLSPEVVMVNATFGNMSGIAILNSSFVDASPGFSLVMVSVDSKDANVNLVAPNIPGVPPNTLHFILDKMIGYSLPIINTAMSDHPFDLPLDLAPFFINAQVRLDWQRGTQGYFEIASYCNRDPNDHTQQRCTYASKVKRDDSKLIISEKMNSNSYNNNSQTENQNTTTSTPPSLSTSTASLTVRLLNSETCEMEVGNQMNGYVFQDTNSLCKPWIGNETFYSLKLSADSSNIVELKYFCNSSDCENCDNVLTGPVEMDSCVPDSVSGISSWFSTTFCLSPPIYTTDLSNNLFWLSASTNCDTTQYFTLQNMGLVDSCTETSDSYSGVFSGTDDLHYETKFECQVSSCSNCSAVASSTLGTCVNYWGSENGMLLNWNDIVACSIDKRPPIPTNWSLILGISIPLSCLLICAILSFVCFKLRWHFPILTMLRAITSFFRIIFGWIHSKFKSLCGSILQAWKNYSMITNLKEFFVENKANEIITLPLIVICFLVGWFWDDLDPFQDFATITIQRTGLPADLVDYSGLDTIFPMWSFIAQRVYYGFAGATTFFVFVRILIGFHKFWKLLWSVYFLVHSLFQAALFFGPQFFIKFPDILTLDSSIPISSQQTLGWLNELFGYTFSGFVITYLLPFYISIIAPLSASFFIGICVLMFREPYQDIENAKGWMISLSVLNCMTHVTVIVVGALPCIVVYQTLATTYSEISDKNWYALLWGCMWFGLWLSSFLFSGFQNYWIRNRLFTRKSSLKTFKRILVLLICLYSISQSICYATIFNTLIWNSKTFLVIIFVTSFFSFLAIVLMAFSFQPSGQVQKSISNLFLRIFIFYPYVMTSNTTKEIKTNFSINTSELVTQNNDDKTEVEAEREPLIVQEPEKESKILNERHWIARIAVFIGLAALIVLLVTSYTDLQTSLKDQIANFIDTYFANTDWPPGKPSLFDDAFAVYEQARFTKYILLSIDTFFVLVLMICEKFSILVSRFLGVLLIVPITFATIVVTILPVYVKYIPFNSIFPFCAKSFNTMVDLVTGNIAGLALASYFTITILPMLVSFPIILGRAGMLLWSMVEESEEFSYLQDVGRNLFAFSLISLPIFVLIPMSVMYQLIGDWQFLALIGFNWLWSLFCGVLVLKNKRISLFRLYWTAWLPVYLLTLLTLIVHVLMIHQDWLSTFVNQILGSVDFWASIVAELCISWIVSMDALVILIRIPRKTIDN